MRFWQFAAIMLVALLTGLAFAHVLERPVLALSALVGSLVWSKPAADHSA